MANVKNHKPKYLIYDKLPTIGAPGESWDMYVVRKMREEREYLESESKQERSLEKH